MNTFDLKDDFKQIESTVRQPYGKDSWITVTRETIEYGNEEVFRSSKQAIRDTFSYFSESQKLKDQLYITGINNLIKKNNLLQQTIQLAEGFITEEEFEQEIDQNPDQFIISIREPHGLEELIVLKNIVKKIGKNFSVDEVSEIFSISLDNYDKFLTQ